MQLPEQNPDKITGTGSRCIDGSKSSGSGHSSTADMPGKTNDITITKGLEQNKQLIMTKMNLLQAILKTNEYGLFGIVESCLDVSGRNFQTEIDLQGFRAFSVDMPSLSKIKSSLTNWTISSLLLMIVS